MQANAPTYTYTDTVQGRSTPTGTTTSPCTGTETDTKTGEAVFPACEGAPGKPGGSGIGCGETAAPSPVAPDLFSVEDLKKIARKHKVNLTTEGIEVFYEQMHDDGWLLWKKPVTKKGIVKALRGWAKYHPEYHAKETPEENPMQEVPTQENPTQEDDLDEIGVECVEDYIDELKWSFIPNSLLEIINNRMTKRQQYLMLIGFLSRKDIIDWVNDYYKELGYPKKGIKEIGNDVINELEDVTGTEGEKWYSEERRIVHPTRFEEYIDTYYFKEMIDLSIALKKELGLL